MTMRLTKIEISLVNAYGITYRAVFTPVVIMCYDVEIFRENELLESYSACLHATTRKAAELIERAETARRAAS